ncbi:MAG: pyruvate, phosphate dikinase [Planctomycetes bacterium]|nr:pyruvate, phosphate dikinase [Planctomycetota bacterium]
MGTNKKYVYTFGGKYTEGGQDMRNLLGGKGANLAEMSSIGIPVPAGFTITTEVCNIYTTQKGAYPEELKGQVADALKKVEETMEAVFGDEKNPLLLSIRSGARQSMPGMMETVLNVGLTSTTIPAMVAKTNNERFVYDSYRRLMMMYSDVVMEKAAGIEPKEGQGIRLQLEEIMEGLKKEKKYSLDTDMTVEDLKFLAGAFKEKIKEVLGKEFPDTAEEQLWGAIGAVFQSWNGKRAVAYRAIENIPGDWGTAVNVQAMVFGNMGENSATGVAFSRNPATGENIFFGEWLINAQGEDVVAGIRTPYALNEESKLETNKNFPTLENKMPEMYKEFCDIREKLEKHYKDMQDFEFTIQEGKLWMLQTRSGKRNGPAALQMAVDMANEGLIDKKTAITRVKPAQLDELLHPMVDPVHEKNVTPLCKGLPAGPGGATGKIVLTPAKADELVKKGEKIILVRMETSPEDIDGMHIAEAVLTARGGMTSHAALVARGWGKCCIVGCGALDINVEAGTVKVGDTVLRELDVITLNGTKGNVYVGALPLKVMDPEENVELKTFLGWCDEVRNLSIRTNADNPKDAEQARRFGAEGIGLCRTEHMFFGEERIISVRKMCLANSAEERETAINEILKYQKEDFLGIFKAMEGLPVTVRLLDPPLHEFVPTTDELIEEFAKAIGRSVEEVKARVAELHETNPMLGHRGCRLGIVYPEITRMQARAILEAAAELTKQGVKVTPEIMVPLVGNVKEFTNQEDIIREVAEAVKAEYELPELHYTVGTMIEVPRAAITADQIAERAEFFSFGTNDLTQMGCGFSRDDSGKFLPIYIQMKIYEQDPFQSIDEEGVGILIRMGIEKGRSARKDLKIGICGEHGGDPNSIDFCHRVGMNYVSCSPFRVPIARLAAAQAAIKTPVK